MKRGMGWRVFAGLSIAAGSAACADSSDEAGARSSEVLTTGATVGVGERPRGPAAGIGFETVIDSAAGPTPYSAAAGDFDGDGFPDLVVTNRDADAVSLLIGLGDGSFREPRVFPAGRSPTGVAAADLNEDGRLDVVASQTGDGDVGVFLGAGDGTLEPPTRSPAAGGGTIALADFDRDGHVDLVESGGDVLLGRGDGTFEPPRPITGGNRGVIAPDWNGDGIPDVGALSSEYTMTAQLGHGDGTFTTASVIELSDRPGWVTAGDFNRDGAADAAISIPNDESWVLIFLGRGDGTFTPGAALEHRGQSLPGPIVVEDLDRDGLLDLAVANIRHGDVSIWFGDGDGGFRVGPRYAATWRQEPLLTADFDGDGEVDLAGPNRDSEAVHVLLGKGGGHFRAARHLDVGGFPIGVTMGLMDDDDDMDIVVTDETTSVAWLYPGRGDGDFDPAVYLPTLGFMPYEVVPGDFNGDGHSDIAFNGWSGPAVMLANGDGKFRFPVHEPLAKRTTDLAVGDVDGDGLLDAVMGDGNAPRVLVFRGRGGAKFEAPRRFRSGGIAVDLVLADLNRDGALDVVSQNGGSDVLSVLLGAGDGTFGPFRYVPLGAVARGIAVADLDGDGALDLAAATYTTALSVAFGRGDGTFEAVQRLATGRGVSSIGVDDFNGDGRPDLAAGSSPGVTILENLGQRQFGPPHHVPVSLYERITVGDVNRDGRADLASFDPLYFIDVVLSSGPAGPLLPARAGASNEGAGGGSAWAAPR